MKYFIRDIIRYFTKKPIRHSRIFKRKMGYTQIEVLNMVQSIIKDVLIIQRAALIGATPIRNNNNIKLGGIIKPNLGNNWKKDNLKPIEFKFTDKALKELTNDKSN